MAYGSSELDVAATTVDKWVNAGTNGIDLFASHNPLVAILYDSSQEPDGEYQFMQADVADGNQWKVTVSAAGNATVAGVTRANQINAITPTVTTNVATNAKWPWTHYQGMIFDNYEDQVKNSGSSQMVDLGQMIKDQISSKFFDVLGNDLMDNAAGSISKIQSVNDCLKNTGLVGGIDQSDTANNLWWNAQQDTSTQPFDTLVFDQVVDACTHDTGRKTGIRKHKPDVAFLYGGLYSKLRQELKPSQRQEVSDMLKGGASYLLYDGVRCFRTTRQVSGTVLILNSSTWAFRYKTKMPEARTGWVPTSGTPSMWEQGYNWMVGFGGYSMKHNGLLTNKS